jgi:DNA repair ATPase RecN
LRSRRSTRDVYRFATTVEAGKLEKLAVAERRRLDQTVILSDLPIEATKIYLSAETISPAVRDALGKVVEMRRDLEGTTFELRRRETRVKEIDQEQNRIRQNMERLSQNSDLYGRYVQILTTQEDELASLRKQMTELRERQDEQRKALDDYLLSLDI